MNKKGYVECQTVEIHTPVKCVAENNVVNSGEQEQSMSYGKYKLQWMLDHGYTLDDLIEQLERMEREHPDMTLTSLFEDWEYGFGFAGEIWASYEEFSDCEKE